jgi:uncharacterized protein
MKTRAGIAWLCIVMATVLIGFSASIVQADTKAEVLKRMGTRLADLLKAKADGKAGEVWNGTIEAVKGADETLTNLLAAENADRAMYFDIKAKETGGTAALAGEAFGKDMFDRAKKGEFLKGKDGQWRQKP